MALSRIPLLGKPYDSPTSTAPSCQTPGYETRKAQFGSHRFMVGETCVVLSALPLHAAHIITERTASGFA